MSSWEKIVISFGGSVIYKEDGINRKNLEILKEFINNFNGKVLIVTGGGILARKLMGVLNKEIDKHEIGLKTTKLNAFLLAKYLNAKYLEEPLKYNWNEKIAVTGGFIPGVTSDFDCALLAYKFGIKNIINVSNVDYLYDKDPRKFEDAKPIKKITGEEVIKKFLSKSKPGENFVFDLDALFFSYRRGINVYIVGIKNLIKVIDFINGNLGEFPGTIIKNETNN